MVRVRCYAVNAPQKIFVIGLQYSWRDVVVVIPCMTRLNKQSQRCVFYRIVCIAALGEG